MTAIVQAPTGFLERVTPVILTYNEAPNIARVLAPLHWAGEIVVVDSGSEDETLEMLARDPRVRCVRRAFDSHARQWNFALEETGVSTEWVLALDADYVLSDALVTEFAGLDPPAEVAGYETRFRYLIHGRALSGSLYPPVTTLFRRGSGRFEQDGHTQRVRVNGTVRRLQGFIDHDDRKPLARWLSSQEHYAALEADILLRTGWRDLSLQDRLRRCLVFTPWLVPLYCLTVRGGVLDGKLGIHYALQRGIYESILAMKLIGAAVMTGGGVTVSDSRRDSPKPTGSKPGKPELPVVDDGAPDRTAAVPAIEARYQTVAQGCAHTYLLPGLLRMLGPPRGAVLDIGCGNGAIARELRLRGYDVYGVDASESGIRLANEDAPGRFFVMDVCAGRLPMELAGRRFDTVLSTEVIEHLYDPRGLMSLARDVLADDGRLILSTPYHGYLKNLVLAASGALDAHFTVLWDGGHIKFLSRRTLAEMLGQEGFEVEAFAGVGRVQWLWKSMLVKARRAANAAMAGRPGAAGE